jgi:hypothetical protein
MHAKGKNRTFSVIFMPSLIYNLLSLIHIQRSWNHNIQISISLFFPSSEFLYFFSISLKIYYQHSLLILLTYLEKGTLDKISFFNQSWDSTKKRKSTLGINGLTMVLQLLCWDACLGTLNHWSDCHREGLFGRMGQKRKTPGANTISTC